MDLEDKEKINTTDKTIIHSTPPNSELRSVVFNVLDVDNNGVINLADWKYIIKFITKWVLFILGIIFALRDEGTINIYNISGWTTILSVVASNAYQIFKRRKDAEELFKKIYKYRDLILSFIDLINDIIHKTAEQDISMMLQEFLITMKDSFAREEINKNLILEEKLKPPE